MTQVEWEKIFLDNLAAIPEAERFKMAEYYREIYGDKLEAGQTPDEVLAEFGDPQECAKRILKENENVTEEILQESKPLPEPKMKKEIAQVEAKQSVTKKRGYWTPATIVGMVFLTLLLIAPISSGVVAVIAALGAMVLVGGVLVLAGCLYVVIAPFMGITGASFGAIVAHMGMGFALCGAGILVGIAFWFAVKYAVIGCWKALVWIYRRGN